MRAVGALTVLALASASCAYGVSSLPTRAPIDGTGLPLDGREEHARRTSRRLWSFAVGAAELGLGVLAHTLATHSDGRGELLFEGASELFFVFGAGDLVLAAVDSALATPFVDAAGDFQRPDHFSAPGIAPSSRWQADAGIGASVASQRRVEGHYDVAVFRWLTPTLRMRYQLGVDHGVDFAGSSNETYVGLGGGAAIEWSPSRRHYGRHPHSALAFALLPRAVVGNDRDTAFGLRATLGWEIGPIAVGVGATQIFGDDTHPGVEVWLGGRPVDTD